MPNACSFYPDSKQPDVILPSHSFSSLQNAFVCTLALSVLLHEASRYVITLVNVKFRNTSPIGKQREGLHHGRRFIHLVHWSKNNLLDMLVFVNG